MPGEDPLAILDLDQGEGPVLLVHSVHCNAVVASIPHVHPVPAGVQPHLGHSALGVPGVGNGGKALDEEEEIVWRTVLAVSGVLVDSKVLNSCLIVPEEQTCKMSIIIHHCLSMSFIVLNCPALPITVHHCLSLSTIVYDCL